MRRSILIPVFIMITVQIVFRNSCSEVHAQSYTPKYHTFAHTIKDIHHPILGKKLLDAVIDSTKNLFDKESYSSEEGKALLKKTDSILKTDFSYLKHVLDPCFTRSLCYLAVGEENNLPLKAVTIPGGGNDLHMFVRWDANGKHKPLQPNAKVNKGDFNFETIEGKVVPDSSYNSPLISKNAIENGIYLSNHSKNQLKGMAHWMNASYAFIKEKGPYKTIKECDKALRVDSNSPKAWYIKAVMNQKLENREKADQFYKKSININPGPRAYFDRASNLKRIDKSTTEKKEKEVLSLYDSAINLAKKAYNEGGSRIGKESIKEIGKAAMYWKSIELRIIGERNKGKKILNNLHNKEFGK